MKKYFLIILLFFPFGNHVKAQIPLPQLQAGVFVNDSLCSLYYCFPGNCDTLGDVIMTMDTNLISCVSGIEFKYIVVSLTSPPGSVYTLENGILNAGDTLTFSAVNNHFSFYASANGCAVFNLVITGTPSVPFENYPCAISWIITLSNCFNTHLIYADTMSLCTVSDFNAMNEFDESVCINLYPNPFTKNLDVKTNSHERSEIVFYDIMCRESLKHLFTGSASINTEQLAKGIYFYEIRNKNGLLKKGKVMKPACR